MEDKIKNAMEFYLLATKLKYKIRTGWDKNHWNINSDRLESVINIDINKVLKMLTLHEIGEVLIGDITPFDNVTEEEKERIEHKAMLDVLGDLDKKDEYYNLLL